MVNYEKGEPYGNRIKNKNKKKENRFTQIELAKLVSVSSQVILNWERGYSNLSSGDVARLADALNCSTEYLLGKNMQEKDKHSEEDDLEALKQMWEIIKKNKKQNCTAFRGRVVF